MFPDSTPLTPAQQQALATPLAELTPLQRAWLGGFLSAAAPAATTSPAAATPLTILYGTESGNAEALADLTAKAAKKAGFKAKIRNMSATTPADLEKMPNLLVIVSTWGEGDPPETAADFYHAFLKESPDLSKVRFSVCALGDTSYERFCQTGKDLDARLDALGATRIHDRVDCDVDFDDAHATWMKAALQHLAPATPAPASAPAASLTPPASSLYDKKNPFPAEVLANQRLTDIGSEKETLHLEFSLEGSGLQYQPGDALAVLPENAPDVVADLLAATGFDPQQTITLKKTGETTIGDALRFHLDITTVSKAVLKKYQTLAQNPNLEALLADEAKDALKNWLWGRQLIDLLTEFPITNLQATDFLTLLRPLPPRLYSIASSPLAHPDEVHLTVAAVRYHTNGRDRKGVASTYLADLAPTGSKVKVYTHLNKNFRLPENPATPIIMVGPGTGIAPFRAFIEHRAETEASGESWLFFGEQRFNHDFLYQLELYDHLKSGALTHLEVAFSRDQEHKVYVQHRLAERGSEVYALLEKGAHFYVCGDASRMAQDVHDTLLNLIAEHGQKSPEEAQAYLDNLRKTSRYQRDVY